MPYTAWETRAQPPEPNQYHSAVCHIFRVVLLSRNRFNADARLIRNIASIIRFSEHVDFIVLDEVQFIKRRHEQEKGQGSHKE